MFEQMVLPMEKQVNNWIREHYDDDLHPPQKPLSAPLTANVTSKAPLEVDLFWSMRSPYCYLALEHRFSIQNPVQIWDYGSSSFAEISLSEYPKK
ncbi:MAG: hypothetical protein QNJ41_27640 [Xenococcaceae cyanobacterium MO_188.B32]|nr:hypothetical protein [Xenococcaceae cyanobacterium MO_188.B32]